MIDFLIRWSLHNRAAVLLMATLLCAVGGYLATRMPIDVFPDLTAPTVTVITEAHGMDPTEVESQVTFPIEAALNGSPGVRRVRSSTAVGISVVWVEFEWGADIYLARQVVSEKLALVTGDLPPDVERPILAPISSIMGEVMFLSLTSEHHTPIELRTTADSVIRRRLLSVPGVAQVTPIGGGEKQYQVVLSPEKLNTYGLSISQVSAALSASNENVSAGFMVEGGSEYLVKGLGRYQNLNDIAQTVVTSVDGVPIKVSDLGSVQIGEAPKRGEGSAMGKPAVIIGIQKQPGANTLTLTRELDSVMDDLSAKLPQGMKINKHLFRQADFIQVAVNNVVHALRDGGILVIIIVLVFLANLRATLITLTAIPLSLVSAILVLWAFDATINTMTLGGMAIAIGALVDDAIIDVENVFRRLRENAAIPEHQRRPTLSVVLDASIEIRSSIVFATVIIVLVFTPLFFLSGVEGRLLRPLGVAYVVSLAASLFVAVTVTPALCHLLLPNSKGVRTGHEPLLVRWLKAGYGKMLKPILTRWWLVTLPSVLLLAGAVFASTKLGFAFLPEFNEGSLTIAVVTLPGTSLAESNELGRIVEQTLMQHPEVVAMARRTGRAELDEHAQGVEAAELEVSLSMKERSKEVFLDALRQDLSQVPGVNITIGQPISHRIDHMLSGTRASVAIKIFGEDLYRLRKLAEKARQEISTVPGVVDLSVEQQMDIPILKTNMDRAAMAHHGLQVQDVAHTLEAGLQGSTVSRVIEGRNSFDLVVKVAGTEAWTTDTLGDLPIHTPQGYKVALRSVADIRKDAGPNTISREQVERKIVISCNVAGRDVTSVVQDIRSRVDPILAEEPGYSVEYGGQFESATEAGRVLVILGIAVILAIGLVLHLAFGSARDAFLIMLNLPLALIGGILGVFVSGGVLSVASMIGFITVFGIAARNGIMLVSHIRHLQEHEGVTDFQEAVYRGSLERLAPILMTALAAGLALIPLALGGGKPGNEIQTPMAIVILFGLLSSMLLNMIVVPALYLRFGKPSAGN
ncbi:MAG: efflux RND transporter permease subunit [Planctomycetes bacterium]|nr:efflux RND transporter permease subunit [Planctomycetota bacterium]